MQTNCCVSGFIYNDTVEQILLRRKITPDNCDSDWKLFDGSCPDEASCKETFLKIIYDNLGLKLSSVLPIYTYQNQEETSNHILFYAKIKEFNEIPAKNGFEFGWFDFRQISKLKLNPQVEHDIIVGQRVIDSAERKSRGEQTIG